MYLLIFIVGLLLGIIIANVIRFRYVSIGELDVDHDEGLVKVHLNSGDLDSKKTKKVILSVNHNANLSQK